MTRTLGPNHKDGCTGTESLMSGNGYNRVRVCACGAEDHEPDMTDYDIDAILLQLGGDIARQTLR